MSEYRIVFALIGSVLIAVYIVIFLSKQFFEHLLEEFVLFVE